jgi:hypothetical protein
VDPLFPVFLAKALVVEFSVSVVGGVEVPERLVPWPLVAPPHKNEFTFPIAANVKHQVEIIALANGYGIVAVPVTRARFDLGMLRILSCRYIRIIARACSSASSISRGAAGVG